MEAAVERLAAIGFLLTGISHLVAPRALVELFAGFGERGRPGSLMNAAVHLPIGMMLAAFHPVWSGPGIGLTLIGWSLVLKGTLYIAFPDWGVTQLRRFATEQRVGQFRIAGVVAIAIGLYAAWLSLGAPWP